MGKTPHGGGNADSGILLNMKRKQELELPHGGFITAAYPAWLARLARKSVRSANQAQPLTLRTFCSFRERLAGTSLTKVLADRIELALAIAMLTALTGCIGVVGGGGGYVGGGGWWWDDGGWWGGGHGYDRGRDVHAFGVRGAESRGAAHGGGEHGGRR
jgi:hypothetical protein